VAVAEEQRLADVAEIRGDVVKAEWGQQIRNYVMHPYKMVKVGLGGGGWGVVAGLGVVEWLPVLLAFRAFFVFHFLSAFSFLTATNMRFVRRGCSLPRGRADERGDVRRGRRDGGPAGRLHERVLAVQADSGRGGCGDCRGRGVSERKQKKGWWTSV
jgi:hypothetical protein